MLESQEEMENALQQLEVEKLELLEDNQKMAKMLDSSEGDRKEVAGVLERLEEERTNFKRQCRQFKDKGWTVNLGTNAFKVFVLFNRVYSTATYS